MARQLSYTTPLFIAIRRDTRPADRKLNSKLGQQLRRLVTACVATTALVDQAGNSRPRVVLLGLDGAGKTSLLHRLTANASKVTNCEGNQAFASSTSGCPTVQSSFGFDIVDVPGDVRLRPLWRYYAAPRDNNAQAVVFVVDATDAPARLDEAGRELAGVLSDDAVELAGAPLLALANKRDLPGCASLARIRHALQLDRLSADGRPCQLLSVSATTGEGLLEARQLLERLLAENRRHQTRCRRRYSRRRREREIWRRQQTVPPPPPPPPPPTHQTSAWMTSPSGRNDDFSSHL